MIRRKSGWQHNTKQSLPSRISGNVQDIRGDAENECNELANENEKGINNGESIMDMLNDCWLVSKPIPPANVCKINAKSLLSNQPPNFSCTMCVFNNRKRSFKITWHTK